MSAKVFRGVHRARVLIVDDDRQSARILREVLGAGGFHAASVRTTAVAQRVLLAEDVSVVVVSFRAGGIAKTTQLVARFRSRPEPQLRHAAIVAIADDRTDARFGLDAEADAVLVRPFDAADLVDAVTEAAATDSAARASRRSAPLEAQVGASSGSFSE